MFLVLVAFPTGALAGTLPTHGERPYPQVGVSKSHRQNLHLLYRNLHLIWQPSPLCQRQSPLRGSRVPPITP